MPTGTDLAYAPEADQVRCRFAGFFRLAASELAVDKRRAQR